MIKKYKQGFGLKDYKSIQIKDETRLSDWYFRVFDFPEKLYVGKNAISIRPNKNYIVDDSLLYIDVYDSAGNIIYHEVSDHIDQDGSRLLIIYVYEDTAPGDAKIYIAGRLKKLINGHEIGWSTNKGSYNHMDNPNLLWVGQTQVILNESNRNNIIFSSPPIVTVKERFEYYKKQSGSLSRLVEVTSSIDQTMTLNSTIKTYSQGITSKFAKNKSPKTKYIPLDSEIDSSGGLIGRQEYLQDFLEGDVIVSSGFGFDKNMIGGSITFSNLNEFIDDYTELEVIPPMKFNIIDIIDKNKIKISPEFKYISSDGKLYNNFKNANDFIVNYYTSDIEMATIQSESFVQVDFANIEPIAGHVDKINIKYKPYGTFGEFINIGDFDLNEQNYLVDKNTLIPSKYDIIEKPIGDLTSFNSYWQINNGYKSASIETSSVFDNGILIRSDQIQTSGVNYDYYFELKNDYTIQTIPNTEYKLQFSSLFDDNKISQIDVYISGSLVIRDVQNERMMNSTFQDYSFGEYIGTVTNEKTNKVLDKKIYFKCLNSGSISPKFIVKNSNGLEIKDIIISPRNELGYSPNQANLNIPISLLKTDVELVMSFDYYNSVGYKAPISTIIYGLNFTGSDALMIDYKISSSIDNLSSSIAEISSSIDDRINEISGSITTISSSIDDRIDNVSSSLDTKIIELSENVLDISGSIDTRIDNVSSSITTISSSIDTRITTLSGSVSSSLSTLSQSISNIGSGSGSQLAFWETNTKLTSDPNLIWNNTNKFLGIGVAPAQQLDMTGNIKMVASTATNGNIYKGTTPFIHDFGVQNNFVGLNSGNFTMTGTSNSAQGSQSLLSNTTGTNNTAVGYYSLRSNTDGTNNVAIGGSSMRLNTTSDGNSAYGVQSLYSNTTGNYNSVGGYQALYSNISGIGNIAQGFRAGRYVADGSTGRTTGNYGLYLGYNTKASADGTTNENVLGYNVIGQGSNSFTYGHTTITKHIFQAGNIGFGTTAPSAKIHGISTTEQQRLGYDASNYMSITVGSTGSTTFELTGTTPTFTFGKDINLGSNKILTNSIELGNSSDTSITRVSAGKIAVEGVTIPTETSTSTLTNKRITKRVDEADDKPDSSINIDNYDMLNLNAMSSDTTISVTGTPTTGQELEIMLQDNGTSRALTWSLSYITMVGALPTSTSSGKVYYIKFKYQPGGRWVAIQNLST